MTEAKSFPLPSDLTVVPGTEGAQAAYPYYTQFVPEDDQKFWFYNSMHFPEPMHHFDMITAEAAYVALGRSTPGCTCCRPPRGSSTG
jgi:pyruvate,water dikinase